MSKTVTTRGLFNGTQDSLNSSVVSNADTEVIVRKEEVYLAPGAATPCRATWGSTGASQEWKENVSKSL